MYIQQLFNFEFCRLIERISLKANKQANYGTKARALDDPRNFAQVR